LISAYRANAHEFEIRLFLPHATISVLHWIHLQIKAPNIRQIIDGFVEPANGTPPTACLRKNVLADRKLRDSNDEAVRRAMDVRANRKVCRTSGSGRDQPFNPADTRVTPAALP